MYRYVERETSEGKTTRTGGNTNVSLKAMKHLSKIGKPLKVRGYVYRGRHNTQHVAVMVHGDKGTIRFGGFSWGYTGQGSRGLNELFKVLGINKNACTHDLGSWPDWTVNDIGEKWVLYI